jgi:hypothetical protein
MARVRALSFLLLFAGIAAGEPPPRKHSNAVRMTLPRLKAVNDDVLRLRSQRIKVPPLPGLNDYRCILHAHAEDSTHTGGTVAEMIADAKTVGIHCILLTDHFRPPRDFIDGRPRGLKDGILFIPGSEIRGFLVYPNRSILDRMELKTPDFVSTVTAGDGMIFLSHIEERKDHSLDGLTGLEITNRHYDAKRDVASLVSLALKMTDSKSIAELKEAVEKYPDELFAFHCDYPKVYLDKWDAGCKVRRLTGVAANDCHHNQILTLKMVDADTVLVGTNVDTDDKMQKFLAETRPGIKEMTKGRNPGDVLAKVDIDPYRVSFRNSCTHVLAPKLDETTIRSALKQGRAFVAHDWMADASGFRFEAESGGKSTAVMGGECRRTDVLKLTAKLPLPAYVRILRDGVEVAKYEERSTVEFDVQEAGSYRLEAWLKLDGEYRPWIYANPIAVR